MRKPKHQLLEQIFHAQIEHLAITLRPNSLHGYRASIRNFLRYLAMCHPQIHTLDALRRDPHILGWIRHLAARNHVLSKATRRVYLLCVRRLLDDLASSAKYALRKGLIVQTDLPRPDHYLPKPLSPEDDRLLQQHLRTQDDMYSDTLLLLRHTGMRIGELLNLPTDCLRHLDGEQWALHVPLGKLHTERWVPVDEQIRQLYARVLLLRQERALATNSNLLLPHREHWPAYLTLSRALKKAAQQAGCSRGVTPHQLRHTYATEMLRAGASLPALMHLLGHKSITMTLRYVQVTQNDLQREFQRARQNMATLYAITELPCTRPTLPTGEVTGILKSLTATNHLVEMFRRRLSDETSRRKIARLANRLLKVTTEFRQFVILIQK
jgi:site-specific recombinase XerD